MNLSTVSIIGRKRDQQELSESELEFLVRGFTEGSVTDYQMAAFAMAVYCRGMSVRETSALTRAMLHSGRQLRWDHSAGPVVDKHSTGGVGDKVSLLLAPLLACCETVVPMISGRGLGPTGGTLDKLESISGFRTDLSIEELHRVVEYCGCVITGATPEIAPADRKLYALRDVTATVGSIPLITASIMSKKLAEGLDALVLDVKVGKGAFMKTLAAARRLAESLVSTGTQMGVPTRAVLTDMNQPLGRAIGNSIEVDEAVEALRGSGPSDLYEVTERLGAELLVQAGTAASVPAGRATLRAAIDTGRGLERFEQMVAAQGGDLSADRERAREHAITADRGGYVVEIDTAALGVAVIDLGGGRRVASDQIDHGVGIELCVRIGDTVSAGERVMRVFARESSGSRVLADLRKVITIGDEPPTISPLIIEACRQQESG